MKLHRVFIAINLPEGVKRELLAYRDKWPELPAKWVAPENLHVTLAFLGNTSDQELAEVCELMQQIGDRHNPFPMDITRITYGPKPSNPRMIWAVGKRSPKLLALKHDVGKTLGPFDFAQGKQQFSPHLTLARIKTFQLQRMEAEEIPEINQEISLSFQASSIEVMESQLKRSGAEYTVCQSMALGKNS